MRGKIFNFISQIKLKSIDQVFPKHCPGLEYRLIPKLISRVDINHNTANPWLKTDTVQATRNRQVIENDFSLFFGTKAGAQVDQQK